MPYETVCTFPACGRPRHGFSHYCGNHAAYAYLHGHPAITKGIREHDYKPFGVWVGAGLLRYCNTTAVQSARALADTILNYRATNGFTFQRTLEHMLARLLGDQVTADDVLHRVCLHVAYTEVYRGRFRGVRAAEDLALARCVMRLAPLGRKSKRDPRRSLLLLGEMLREDLYVFAISLINRLKEDAEKAHALRVASVNFDTPAEVT
jgi:hypothetical protein